MINKFNGVMIQKVVLIISSVIVSMPNKILSHMAGGTRIGYLLGTQKLISGSSILLQGQLLLFSYERRLFPFPL